jgi:transposase
MNKLTYAESIARLEAYAEEHETDGMLVRQLMAAAGVSNRMVAAWRRSRKNLPTKTFTPYSRSFDAIESYAERHSIDGMSVEAIAQATGVSHKAAQIWHQRRRQAADRQRVEGRQRLFWVKGSRLFSMNRIPNEVGQ